MLKIFKAWEFQLLSNYYPRLIAGRHHENFMVTVDGRLVHVDFGYALGREPLDSVLIHIAATRMMRKKFPFLVDFASSCDVLMVTRRTWGNLSKKPPINRDPPKSFIIRLMHSYIVY